MKAIEGLIELKLVEYLLNKIGLKFEHTQSECVS